MWRSKNPCTLLVGLENGAATLGDSLSVPQEVEKSQSMTQQFHSLGIHSAETKTYVYTNTCTQNLLTALFIATKAGTAQISVIDEWINKMQYIHTVEYYFLISSMRD